VELFSEDGEFIESIRFQLPPDTLGARSMPRALLSGKRVLAGPAGISITGVNSGWLDHGTWLVTDSVGTVLREVLVQPFPETDFFRGSLGEDRFMEGPHPLPERPEVAEYPDGSGWVVVERTRPPDPDSASYGIRVFAADGTLQSESRMAYDPIPKDSGWFDRFYESRVGRGGELPPEPSRTQMKVALREALSERRYFPPVSKVVAGSDGSIWLRREDTESDSIRWDVLDRRGSRLAQVVCPSDWDLWAVSRDEVWGVLSDELDVPYVVGFRVRR
jgi:hypothetical protein